MKSKTSTKKFESKTKMLKVGDKAPDFKLQAADGQEIALASLRGKPVVLYFFPKALTSG
jgi:thioredoxin-dependent peroxiredoxin